MKNAFLNFYLFACAYANEWRVVGADTFPGNGLFASCNQVLGQLSLFEQGHCSGLEVDFGTDGLYYDLAQGPNWWNYFFEPISVGQPGDKIFTTPEMSHEAFERRRRMTKLEAAALVKKYIKVRSPLARKAHRFCSRYFRNQYVVGVHYRGTDKQLEARRVAYDELFAEVDKAISRKEKYILFVATDEEPFLLEAKNRYHKHVVHTKAKRTTTAQGVHFDVRSGYEKGEEAIVDSLILSHCDLLIRTSSNLSLWATYFNPNLPTILLNQRFAYTTEPE